MGANTCELIPDHEHEDGYHYKVSVETGIGGYARTNIACYKPGSDKQHNSQGTDLTAAECRALARMLNATADLLDERVTKSEQHGPH